MRAPLCQLLPCVSVGGSLMDFEHPSQRGTFSNASIDEPRRRGFVQEMDVASLEHQSTSGFIKHGFTQRLEHANPNMAVGLFRRFR